MTQISKISEPSRKKGKGAILTGFHETIGFRGENFSYRAPKSIFLKGCDEDNAILIDSPEDIIPLSVGDIQPLPYLIYCCSKQKALWGAAIIDGEIVLLVDLQKLYEMRGAEKGGKR